MFVSSARLSSPHKIRTLWMWRFEVLTDVKIHRLFRMLWITSPCSIENRCWKLPNTTTCCYCQEDTFTYRRAPPVLDSSLNFRSWILTSKSILILYFHLHWILQPQFHTHLLFPCKLGHVCSPSHLYRWAFKVMDGDSLKFLGQKLLCTRLAKTKRRNLKNQLRQVI